MLITVAVFASLAFIGWLFYRIIKQQPVKAHTITRGLAYVAGVYTLAFFLSMDILQLVKVIISILVGGVLIVLAAYLQRRQIDKS